MFEKLQRILETWNTRKIAVVTILASTMFSVAIVIITDSLFYRSLNAATIARAFFISLSVSAFIVRLTKFVNRLRRAGLRCRRVSSKPRHFAGLFLI